jgi:predicted dehydrogenase
MVAVALVHPAHIQAADAVTLLRRREDVNVAVVMDPDEERGRRWAARLGTGWSPDPDGLLGLPIDACAVYSRTSHHETLCGQIAQAGAALFVEKPLATTLAAVRRVAACLDSRSQLGFFLGYCPAVSELVSRVRSGELGPVRHVAVRFVHDGLTRGWFDGPYAWMADPSEGGGGFFDLAGHCVDLIEQVAGPLAGFTDTRLVGPHHGWAYGELSGGGTATVEAGWQADSLAVEVEVDCDRHRATTCGGRLLIDGRLVTDGPPPAAADALSVFLDRLCGHATAPLVSANRGVRVAEHMATVRRLIAER